MADDFPTVDELELPTVLWLWTISYELAGVESENIARWALGLLDALLERLTILVAVRIDRPVTVARSDTEAARLAELPDAELRALRELFEKPCVGVGELPNWFEDLVVLIDAEQERRACNTMVEHALSAAQAAELKREFNEMLPRPERDLSGLPPWSEASGN
ncbi:hypothetical protein P3H80_12240 [Mycolicibacterium septicum]|uniref:hypothetical protein n=1 Tax=Mycolicibacterium septicum TaxID=98668 RepID=UPI0023E22355|nr:hypothetical protein [Mycolicibacterium septicum]MDF3338197.1 hypothetical protein [Mycolicibacterium septicum]